MICVGTEINLDAATLDQTSGEYQDIPSQSLLIPEYASLRTSGPTQIKRFQEIDKKGSVKPKVFGLIYLFASVEMSATKSILAKKEIFSQAAPP